MQAPTQVNLVIYTVFILIVCDETEQRPRNVLQPNPRPRIHLSSDLDALMRGIKRSIIDDEDCADSTTPEEIGATAIQKKSVALLTDKTVKSDVVRKDQATIRIVAAAKKTVQSNSREDTSNENEHSYFRKAVQSSNGANKEEKTTKSAIKEAFNTKPKIIKTLNNSSQAIVAHPTTALTHIAGMNLTDEKNAENSRRTLKKLKSMRNSPLWSLSKLIDDVSAITETNKRLKNSTVEKVAKKSTEKMAQKKVTLPVETEKKVSNSSNNSAKNESKSQPKTRSSEVKDSLKATLSKAIDNVEKIVANKEKMSATKNNVTVNSSKNQSVSVLPSNSSSSKENPLPKKPLDPYAEIASGPDRPKLPELKTDDGNDAKMISDSPSISSSSPSDISTSAKTESNAVSQPLSGQHDVGGLLDSLTDKLNAAGGGVASDQPAINGNDVKYLQDQLGMDENGGMQPTPPLDGKSDAMPEPPKIPPLLPPAKENPSMLPTDDGLDKDVMEKISSTDEGLGKSLTDKANTLNKFGSLDMMKSNKDPNSDMSEFGDADITPGPDPYSAMENSQGDGGIGSLVDTSHNDMSNGDLSNNDLTNNAMSNGAMSNSDMSNSDMSQFNSPTEGNAAGSLQGLPENIENQMGKTYSPMDGQMGTFQTPDQGALPMSSFEGDLGGDVRSKSKDTNSYITAAMGAVGVDGEAYNARNSIPDSFWNGEKTSDDTVDDGGSNYYNKNYNTHLFKKNLILRPKKDKYVSPFDGKSSFENDI